MFFLLPLLVIFNHCDVDLNTIKFAADLCHDIYYGDENFDFLKKFGGELLASQIGTQAHAKFVLFKHNSDLYLVIRGTSNVGDLNRDCKFVRAFSRYTRAKVHPGFYKESKFIWEIIYPFVVPHTPIHSYNKHNNLAPIDGHHYPKYPHHRSFGKVYFTGHSAGGSVAELIHIYGRRKLRGLNSKGSKTAGDNFESIVFAPAPAVENTGDVLDCSPHITVFIHNLDTIPLLFPSFSSTFFGLWDKEEDVIIGDHIFWLTYQLNNISNGSTVFSSTGSNLTLSAKAAIELGYTISNTTLNYYRVTSDEVLSHIHNNTRSFTDHAMHYYKDFVNRMTSISGSADNDGNNHSQHNNNERYYYYDKHQHRKQRGGKQWRKKRRGYFEQEKEI